MNDIDRRGKLDDEPFSFRETKDGRVMLYWEGKLVKTLAGKDARRFLQAIDGLDGKDEQLVLAKATGNFKRGNERSTSKK